jgi:hypothetical protein
MTKNVVYLVFIEKCFIEGHSRRMVYRVYADRKLAKKCVNDINANKFYRKFDGIWVDNAWISQEYVMHDEATP